MNTFELAKEFIASQRYQVLEEDGNDCHIAFRFQLNTIHFWGNPDDEHFFFMSLPNFAEVTQDNIALVKERCHDVNREVKMVKLYTINDVVLAAAEVYYLTEEDFRFQIKNALGHLVAAKVIYNKLDE